MPCFFKKIGWQSLFHGKINLNLTLWSRDSVCHVCKVIFTDRGDHKIPNNLTNKSVSRAALAVPGMLNICKYENVMSMNINSFKSDKFFPTLSTGQCFGPISSSPWSCPQCYGHLVR